MISKTRKNIEITRLQGPSVNFNEPPYITLKASPKRQMWVRFPLGTLPGSIKASGFFLAAARGRH